MSESQNSNHEDLKKIYAQNIICPEMFYHYTSLQSLKQIIEENNIHSTYHMHLNDHDEGNDITKNLLVKLVDEIEVNQSHIPLPPAHVLLD